MGSQLVQFWLQAEVLGELLTGGRGAAVATVLTML